MTEQRAVERRILVAEDTESIALLMSALLSDQGYAVETAKDGEECVAKVGSFRPQLIFLDLMMPKIHGMEVLRRLKANPETSDIGVIICTGKRYKPDQDQAMELGAFDVLFKP